MTTSTTNANKFSTRNWVMAIGAAAAALAIFAVAQWLATDAPVSTTDNATVVESAEATPSADATRFGGSLSDYEFVDGLGTSDRSLEVAGGGTAQTNGRGLEAYEFEGGLPVAGSADAPTAPAADRPTISGGHQE